VTTLLEQPHAILFDMDGVLVDSEALHWESVGDVLRALLGPEAPTLSPRIGWGDDELWNELRARFGLEYSAQELTALRGRYALTRLRSSPPPAMPDALMALRLWRARSASLPLAVVSASPRAQIDQSLIEFIDEEGRDLFTTRVSGVDDTPHNKPHPDPYLTVMHTLGVTPERCWIAEDSETGLSAALASGARVFAVGAHSAPSALKANCHAELNSLRELYDVWSSLISSDKL
jgi:beta-phosphoglucomutase-like phosphatase (HAD superfamily)